MPRVEARFGVVARGRYGLVTFWATVGAVACSSAQPAPPAARAIESPASATARPDAGANDVGFDDAGPPPPIAIDQYRAAFVRELMRVTKTREANLAEGEVIRADDAAIPHSIEVLKRIGQAESYVVATSGYGRLAHGRRRGHVELLAYVDQYGAKIGQVLEALGGAMWARGENGETWKEYDAVELPAAIHGMQYFDLRGAGEVDVPPDIRVTLLKVVPMSREEYDKYRDNPSGEWDDPNAATRATQRWRRVLERK